MIEPGLTRSELFNFAYEQQKIIDRLRAENVELVEVLKATEYAGALNCSCPDDKWFTCWACKTRAVLAKAEKGE